MKYIFLTFLSLIFLLSFSHASFGQNKTTPTNSITQQQIDELKSKIASKVAELKLVEKRGILGKVTDSSGTQISLDDPNGDIKNIDVDELTKFYSTSTNFGISDIKRGQTLGILGLYNKQSRRILAREVNEIPAPIKILYGVITEIDKENYNIILTLEDKTKVSVEIQDITKTSSFTKDSLIKSGFSKIQILQTVIAVGYPDKNNNEKLQATRLIIFPDVNLAVKLNLSEDLETIPSTGSGVKLYPIKK